MHKKTMHNKTMHNTTVWNFYGMESKYTNDGRGN